MSHTLQLTGLDGANPLGFLAALGALRTATRLSSHPVRMAWQPLKNSWYPVLLGEDDLFASQATLAAAFHDILKRGNPAFAIADNSQMPLTDFKARAKEARDKWLDNTDKDYAAFIAAFGCEIVHDRNNDGINADTAFRTMSGAGHQHFLKFMRELVRNTSEAHVYEALFGPWRFNDTQFSMRWAQEDDRRYALRWDNPSGDPARNVRGANRLAIEGLPFHTTMPVSQTKLETIGFTKSMWSWPLWGTFASQDSSRSLLSLQEIQTIKPDMRKLRPLSIFVVLRSQRITLGKFRNFTPASVIA